MKKRWMILLWGMVLSFNVAAAGRLAVGPLEADFASIEASVPGFAGWYFDADGNAVVMLKDAGRREEAFARVAPLAEARRGVRRGASAQSEIRYEARAARYSFLELAAFRQAVYKNFPSGIVSVDVDEVRNVLALGVDNQADLGRVRAAVAKLGIPGNAVAIEVTGTVQFRTSLQDRHRPLRGGSQIVFRNRDYQLSACSLGVNGMYFNSSDYAGFITASHCTQYPWSYAGNSVGQPTTGAADLVADEFDDPEYFDAGSSNWCPVDTPLSGGWPTVIGCRWSDSAFYRYRASVRSEAWGGAAIHTTTYMNYAEPGSVVINGSLPVTSDVYSVSGTVVHKVGGSSGWTYGLTGATCVDKLARSHANDPFVLLLCQDGSDLYVLGGDSGAAVFRKFDTYVQWAGILWGEDSQGVYYSPVWNVRQDLTNFSY